MEFKVEKKRNSNVKKYKKDELSIALEFAKQAKKEFEELVKGIILFGSAARKLDSKMDENSDIDLLVVLDDVNIKPTPELAEAYRIVCEKIVAKISPRIHITTLKFTTFWDFMKNGDPVGINILRDGVALIDTGFFDPMQALLLRGQIRPSYESIWTYFNRAPKNLEKSRKALIAATVDLYWGVMDAGHAALMKMGCVPPSPEQMGTLIKEKLVDKKICDKKYADIATFFYKINKEIDHRLITDVSGSEYEKYYLKAKLFVEKMRTIINELE